MRSFLRAMMSRRRRRIKPVDDAMTYILSCTDKSGFMSRLVDSYKGRGVFAMQPIEPGDFVHQMFHKESKPDETQPQVTDPQTPAVETETSPVHQMLHKESKPDETQPQVTDPQTPAVETETSPAHQMLHKESKPDETQPQVTDPQTPAVETETSPAHQMLHKESKPDETQPQVTDPQTPAVETETSPAHQMLHKESKPDETQPQVTDPQTPAVETETSPVHQMLHKESKPDETQPQVFTVQGFSLEDFMENKSPTPHRDVLRKITENTLMDSGPEVSNHSYGSESVVNETCDEASPSNHSNEQSDNVLVPSLRRTKSLMWDRVQDFAGCLYDSDDDSTEGTSISKPERDSPRLRRSSCHPTSVYQENRGQKMRRACHPCKNVPPHHMSKARQRLQQMSVCQNNSGQKMRSACHPCKDVPPHHKSKKRVCPQEREVSKLLYSVGQPRRLLQ
ncbi:proteoglycan 4-like isoform X3 [Notolabrus celidotus]|uniref:proteoglycan 4-like isoform X3 n=1 Tax=Notolabrus celidotus TaxID=1203425 RepID=UPI0014905894|nr:proteoglycan 4-like isoform X3 [Notolabrus celidotus]